VVPIAYDPELHLVRDIPFTHYLRNHYPDKPVMTYFHRQAGNWVAGLWHGGKRFIIEMVLLGPWPGAIERFHAEAFDKAVRSKSLDTHEFKRVMKEEERALLRQMDENQALRRRGFEKMKKRSKAHWQDHPVFKTGVV
jgi:hypothetical protein